MATKRNITQTVVLNGRRFPRYLTSPTGKGWRVADMSDRSFLPETYPNKRLALRAAKALNYQPVDVEYADEESTGQLAVGVPGEQRAFPGLAKPGRVTDASIARDKAESPFFCADDYR